MKLQRFIIPPSKKDSQSSGCQLRPSLTECSPKHPMFGPSVSFRISENGQMTTLSGIVLIEIYTLGGELYPGIRMEQMAEHLISGKRIKKPEYMDDKMLDESVQRNFIMRTFSYEIAHSCWHKNPDKRPTFEVLENMFYEIMIQMNADHYLSVIQRIYDIPADSASLSKF